MMHSFDILIGQNQTKKLKMGKTHGIFILILLDLIYALYLHDQSIYYLIPNLLRGGDPGGLTAPARLISAGERAGAVDRQ